MAVPGARIALMRVVPPRGTFRIYASLLSRHRGVMTVGHLAVATIRAGRGPIGLGEDQDVAVADREERTVAEELDRESGRVAQLDRDQPPPVTDGRHARSGG
jgi:hypothetical protein